MKTSARPPYEIAKELAAFLAEYNGTQRELADNAGVSQSTISRSRSFHGRSRVSTELKDLCTYAGIEIEVLVPASSCDPRENALLMDALREVWDGSDGNAKALAKVIKSLKPLCSPTG